MGSIAGRWVRPGDGLYDGKGFDGGETGSAMETGSLSLTNTSHLHVRQHEAVENRAPPCNAHLSNETRSRTKH